MKPKYEDMKTGDTVVTNLGNFLIVERHLGGGPPKKWAKKILHYDRNECITILGSDVYLGHFVNDSPYEVEKILRPVNDATYGSVDTQCVWRKKALPEYTIEEVSKMIGHNFKLKEA